MNDPMVEAFRNVFGSLVTFDIEQEIKRATDALYGETPPPVKEEKE